MTDQTPHIPASENATQVFGHRLIDRMTTVRVSRKLALTLLTAVVLSGAATYLAFLTSVHNIAEVAVLMTINLVLLLLLGFVVGQQILQLWHERQKGTAGARLQTRFVFIFSFLAAAPAVMMAVFSTLFFYFGLQTWFSERINTAINSSLAVAQAYLREHEQVLRADTLAMAYDFNRESFMLSTNEGAMNAYINRQAQLRNISEAIIFQANGNILARSDFSFSLEFNHPDDTMVEEAQESGAVVVASADTFDRIRALVKLDGFQDAYLYVGRPVDSEVLGHLRSSEVAVKEYSDLQQRSTLLQILIMLMFIAVALILLLAAIWFGLMFARQLVKPIGELILASEKISHGDLSTRVVENTKTDDEIAELGRAFNRMTQQLSHQHDDLLDANRRADERRAFTEAVLSGASSGVIGILGNRITIANDRAYELLNKEKGSLAGIEIDHVFPDILDMPDDARDPGDTREHQIEYKIDDTTERTLIVRMTEQQIHDTQKSTVITFDDITALVAAQRKSAWADVARRVAHEIKNPLTPIQLSAERLKRKYLHQITEDQEIFEKCIETIVRQVGEIGRMVAEFSGFARMRDAFKRPEKVLSVVQESLFLQKQAFPQIAISLANHIPDDTLALIDRGQINQVMTNLVQNAIDSIHERLEDGNDITPGRVDITLEQTESAIILICADNGRGLPEKDREKLTDPYITTKKRGSGLGLAIVRKIIEDHGGTIRLEHLKNDQNLSLGARVTVVFSKGI